MRVPHYLTRGPSGLFYVRFRVPGDLRDAVGLKVIKRSTGTTCQRSALACALVWQARYAAALDAFRRGGMDVKKLLESFKDKELRELTLGTVRLPNGVELRGVEIKTAQDQQLFRQTLVDLAGTDPLAAGVQGYMAPPVPPPAPTGVSLDEARRKYQASLKGRNKDKTITQKEGALRDLDAFMRRLRGVRTSVPLASLTRTDFADWLAAQRADGLFDTYLVNRFSCGRDFIRWAQGAGYFPQGDNPAAGHITASKKLKKQRAKTHGSQPYTAAQLARVFDPVNYAEGLRGEASRWLPLLLLYTGARSNEIARLELADLEEVDGLPVLNFTLVGEDKSFKTEASERCTPVHPDLMALGLWERAARLRAAGETKLFPELTFDAKNGPAGRTQHAFSRYLAKLGVKARGEGRLGHHSFRDTVIGAMKAARVPREMREEYTGHELSERHDHAAAYEENFPPAELAVVCHPALSWGLNLEALRPLLAETESRRLVKRPARK